MTKDDSSQNKPGQPLQGGGAAPQQQRGGDVGGITRTADSAIRESKQAPDRTPGVRPADDGGDGSKGSDAQPSSGGLAGTRGGPTAVPEQLGATSADDPPGQEDESPAESLGRAIGAPLSGEAAEREPRR